MGGCLGMWVKNINFVDTCDIYVIGIWFSSINLNVGNNIRKIINIKYEKHNNFTDSN